MRMHVAKPLQVQCCESAPLPPSSCFANRSIMKPVQLSEVWQRGGKGGVPCWSPGLFARRLVATERTGARPISSSPSSSLLSSSGNKTLRRRVKAEQSSKVTVHSSKATASGPTMRTSRFYRVCQERGFGFALYLYVLGESTTLAVLYALHNDVWGTGDAFQWMRAAGVERLVDLDRWSQAGPIVCSLRLSPRLLLNYIVANVATFPFYRLQFAFCAKTFTLLRVAFLPFGYLLGHRSRGRVVPKAPPAAAATRRPNGSLTR